MSSRGCHFPWGHPARGGLFAKALAWRRRHGRNAPLPPNFRDSLLTS